MATVKVSDVGVQEDKNEREVKLKGNGRRRRIKEQDGQKTKMQIVLCYVAVVR